MGRGDTWGGDDERAEGSGTPEDLPPLDWPSLVVPDDARELAAEAEALRRERRAAARRQRLERVLLTRRWQRFGLSGPLVALTLVIVAAFGSLLVIFLPSRPGQPGPGLLANPQAAPGTEGGLLPDATLQVGSRRVSVVGLRPAVVALVPRACRCPQRLEALLRASRSVGMRLVAVGPAGSPPQVPGALPGGRVLLATDPQGTLSTAYDAPTDAVTALVVQGDGVVSAVLPDASPARVEAELQSILSR